MSPDFSTLSGISKCGETEKTDCDAGGGEFARSPRG